MKTIILMRHAKAEAEASSLRDFDRRLTPDGRKLARQTARQLAVAGTSIDRVIVSAARRTLETAQIVAEAICADVPLLALDELYHATAEGYAEAVGEHAEQEEETVLVVGHNPGIGELMSLWADSVLAVPPSTAAVFRFDVSEWQSLRSRVPSSGQLKTLIRHGREVSPD